MITVKGWTPKDPIRLALIIAGTGVYFIFGTPESGWAFLVGTLVGSLSFEYGTTGEGP